MPVSIFPTLLPTNRFSTILANAIKGIKFEIEAKIFRIIDLKIFLGLPKVILFIIMPTPFPYSFSKHLLCQKHQTFCYKLHLPQLDFHEYLFQQYSHLKQLKFDVHF